MLIRKIKVDFPNAKTGFLETVELAFHPGPALEEFVARAKALPNGHLLDFGTPTSMAVYHGADAAGMALAKAMERGLE
jgi:hypothetical protein